jgi:hypothetical protein
MISRDFHDRETTAALADWMVADAVPPNWSPRAEFPANRENNREFFDFFWFH